MSLPIDPSRGRGTRRLFFALWPDETVRQQLRGASRVMTRGLHGRPVPESNLHITLAFLGSIDEPIAQCLMQQADGINLPAFSLTLDCGGFWPGPRVAWLGCEQTPPVLSELVGALQQVQRNCAIEPESRPFHTHLTVMRKLPRRGVNLANFEPISWPVSSFALLSSATLPGGAVYSVVKSWPLKG